MLCKSTFSTFGKGGAKLEPLKDGAKLE